MNLAIKLVFALVFPVVVFFGGVRIMTVVSDRDYKTKHMLGTPPADREPLNQRFGYDVQAVERHWGALAKDPRAIESETRFLWVDLLFPIFYGAALAASLLLVWTLIGRPFSSVWVLCPVIVTVLADWTENSLHLMQLSRYVESGADGLSATWIQIASIATIVKLSLFIASCVILVALIIVVVATSIGRDTKPSA